MADQPKTESRISGGAVLVSCILLAAWFGSMLAHYLGAPGLGADDAATLRNLAVAVASYWIGSSAGSWKKDDRVPSALLAQQAAIVPAEDVQPTVRSTP